MSNDHQRNQRSRIEFKKANKEYYYKRMAELIIGLTRAADLIIGLKPVEPLALIEEAIEFTPINREYIYKLKDKINLSLPKAVNMLITESRNR